MVSEMESVNKNSANNNAAYMANQNLQPVHSPQSVGVEFVRQYYTMLNRAPHLLFRFYSDDSTFVHGCLDKHSEAVQYVRGQKQINAKIMSLNFKNCHTKIRQVDSMETIGNGVVIQVIGELSNNGQPLRRFFQTFVLTPQSPNKYYVRNDIFRYQDEIYFEENEEQLEKNEVETNIESSTHVESSPSESVPVNDIEKDYSYQSNGSSSVNNVEDTPSVQPAVVSQDNYELKCENKDNSEISQLDEIIEAQTLAEETVETSNSDSVPRISQQLSIQPKTYANMVSKNFQGISNNTSNAAPSVNLNIDASNVIETAVNNAAPTPVSAANSVAHPVLTLSSVVNKNVPFSQRENRFPKKNNFQRRNESRESNKNNDSDSGEGENQMNSLPKKYPDENQLFIGNLLPNFCEEDLLNIFQRFGKIIEVRINRQIHKVNSGNKNNRNYGFITFENPEVVDQIIAQKPIYHEHHRYNVEKKQGKSSFNRTNQNNNSPRNVNQSSSGNPGIRHSQSSSGGGGSGAPNNGNVGPRNRPGANYNNVNSGNNGNNRNFSGGQNFANRNNYHQQNR